MTLTIPLTSCSAGVDEALVGAKALGLMRMLGHGFNVPPGFVLTSVAFESRGGLNLQEAIREDVGKLGTPWVMVRSSAIGEDGAERSFAGQLDSFQVANKLEDIAAATQRCWDSLTNARAQVYGTHTGESLQRMGVVIQEMVEPDYAGVMFTASPTDATKSLVEYVEGHCDKLVSGRVTPESFTLPSSGDEQPAFSRPLEDASAKLIRCFGSHQDVEWAWKDGQLFLVQSRPITNTSRPTHWSSTNLNENYPEKLSPLLYSIARRSYYFYFKRLCQALGLPITPEHETTFYNIVGLWGDRIYYNMTSVHEVIGLTPFRSVMHDSFDRFVGYEGDTGLKGTLGGVMERARFLLRLVSHGWRLRTYVERIEGRVEAFAGRPTTRELASGFHDFLDIRFNFWVHASFADFFAMLSHGALGTYLQSRRVENATGLQNSLIQSIPNLVSNQPIFELWSLKQFVTARGFTELFERDAEVVLHELQHTDGYEELHAKVQDYLTHWGFRCSGELTFLTPNYQESPVSFIRMLKIYVAADSQDPHTQFQSKYAEQRDQLAQVVRKLGVVQGTALRALVRFTRFAVSCRERVRIQQARAYAHFKAICLSLGKQLAQGDVLEAPADVFFLEFDEVSRLLNQEWVDKAYLQSLVALRRSKMDQAEECLETFSAHNADYKNTIIGLDDAPIESDGCYVGLPACGGVIRARAVVLESLHEIGRLKKGDILVTKQTDPGWICAFPLISGLVVERGGMLSHGAIVAREFGIPAVVGLKGITQHIQTDDIVLVDGNRGVVECHPG
jgi:phosphohistidine swiveling domain-containing protein